MNISARDQLADTAGTTSFNGIPSSTNSPSSYREKPLTGDVNTRCWFRSFRRSASLVASMFTAGLLLSACGSGITGNNFSEDSADTETNPNTASGEPAVAQDSPTAKKELAGELREIDGLFAREFTAAARVGLDGGGDSIAVLLPGELLILDTTQPEKPQRIDVPENCRNVNTSSEGVAVSCTNEVLEFDAHGDKLRTLTVDGDAKTATFTDTGRAIVGLAGSDRVHFFDAEGNKANDQIVSRSIDQAVLVQPHAQESDSAEQADNNDRHSAPQRVGIIDEGQTSVTDVDPSKDTITAALRIGQGVGQINSGGSDDGVLIASDNKQNQMLVYTMNDVVRLHQTVPTGTSPWATMWDTKTQLAWVATTGDNKLSAYTLSTGTPRLVAQLDTIANVRGVFSAADGGLVVLGRDGLVQTLTAKDVHSARDAGLPRQEEIGQKYIGGQS